MTQHITEILINISTSLSAEEILSRLDMTPVELVEYIRPVIEENLSQFSDIYEGDYNV